MEGFRIHFRTRSPPVKVWVEIQLERHFTVPKWYFPTFHTYLCCFHMIVSPSRADDVNLDLLFLIRRNHLVVHCVCLRIHFSYFRAIKFRNKFRRRPLHSPGKGCFTWIRNTIFTDDETFLRTHGLDSFMFVITKSPRVQIFVTTETEKKSRDLNLELLCVGTCRFSLSLLQLSQ